MSTRSNILARLPDGRWGRIYCHFDGYPTGVGATLAAHYVDPAKIAALIALGNLSSLDERCDGAEGHSYAHKLPDQTVAYGRDRGEQGVGARYGASLEEVWPDTDGWEEYLYIWDGERWGVTGAQCTYDDAQDNIHVLADILAKEDPDGAIDAPVIMPFLGVVGNHKTADV